MKKQSIFASLILTLFIIAITSELQAQSITLIPNPDGNRGLKGFFITYNNNLYFKYQQSAYVLGQYNGSTGDSLITNPDASAYGYNGFPIIYNNSFYYTYLGSTNKYQLVKYDGTTQTLYPNPDLGSGFIDDPTLFNNHLLFRYQSVSGDEIAEFDGSTTHLVPNPTSGAVDGDFIIYNNNLYVQYNNSTTDSLGQFHLKYQMAVYDGTNLKLINNPDSGFGYYYLSGEIVFQNNLYINYENASGKYQMAKYDGISLSLIPNPDAGAGLGDSTVFILYNNNLYFNYENAAGKLQLAKYDGNAITLIANPDLGNGFIGYPIVYDGNLYFQYQSNSYVFQLAKFDGTSVTLFPNPEAGQGFLRFPIIYSNSLYFEYQNTADVSQLAQFKGDSIHLIPNPDGGTGFTIAPVVFNGSLYFGYYNASFIPQLARFSDNTLPLTLLSFSATGTKENTVALNWQTSTEINTDYFELQRGTDAAHFNGVAKIVASGNSAYTENYKYSDSLISFQGNIPPVIFYRLNMTDKDGRFTYSKIISVKMLLSASIISVMPNPVQNILSITYTSPDDEQLLLNVFEMNGKAILAKKVVAVKGINKYELPFTNMSSAIYLLQIKGNNSRNTTRIIK